MVPSTDVRVCEPDREATCPGAWFPGSHTVSARGLAGSNKCPAFPPRGVKDLHPNPKVTVLPEAGRDEQMVRWGVQPERVGLRREHDEAADFKAAGGWSIATVSDGGGRGHGLTSHRGVLHPDEYVDEGLLSEMVLEALGFTLDEVRYAYRPGRPASDVLALRRRIDARLLEVHDAGGNTTALARVFGWPLSASGGGDRCRNMERAVSRARAARAEAVAA